MNTMYFQDLVRGCYGRKIAYTNVDTITTDNVVKVIGNTVGVFNGISQLLNIYGITTKVTNLSYTELSYPTKI